MKNVQVDYESLTKLAGKITQQYETLVVMHIQLRGYIRDLESGGWVGPGADAFYLEMNDFVLPSVNRLVQAVQSAESVTKRIMADFKDAEERAQSLILDGTTASNSITSPNSKDHHTVVAPSGKSDDSIKEDVAHPHEKKVTVGGEIKGDDFNDKREFVTTPKLKVDYEVFSSDNAKVEVGASISDKGLKFDASASAHAMKHKIPAESLGGYLAFEGKVGADVDVDAGFKFDPMKGNVYAEGGAEAFFGVEATASSTLLKSEEAEVTTEVGVRAGLGGELKGNIGFKDGVFSMKGKGGFALGFGVKMNVDVSLNVPKTGQWLADVGKKAIDYIF